MFFFSLPTLDNLIKRNKYKLILSFMYVWIADINPIRFIVLYVVIIQSCKTFIKLIMCATVFNV